MLKPLFKRSEVAVSVDRVAVERPAYSWQEAANRACISCPLIAGVLQGKGSTENKPTGI